MSDDPNRPNFEVPNIGLADAAEARRLGDRVPLRQSLDNAGARASTARANSAPWISLRRRR